MKNITFIVGHYGSGKSEFSINYAINKGIEMIIDLDVVNPYFRSREVEQLLNENKIELAASPLEKSSGSDLPFVSSKMYFPFYKEIKAVYDLGGNDVGAKLLRQFSELVKDYDMFLVINIFREETETKEKIIKMINQIEGSSGLSVTGLINNTNLLRDTTKEDVLLGEQLVKEVSKELNLPIVFTSVKEDLANNKFEGEVMPLKLYLRKEWL